MFVKCRIKVAIQVAKRVPKGFSVDPFVDGSRENLQMIKWLLVEP
jgi:hypothetical protein